MPVSRLCPDCDAEWLDVAVTGSWWLLLQVPERQQVLVRAP